MRSRSCSTVQPPCSGWPAKARLLVSTQASSSWPGHEGPGDQGPGGALRRRPRGGAGRASGAGRARARSRAPRRGRRRRVRPAWPRGGPGRSGERLGHGAPDERRTRRRPRRCRGQRDRRRRGARWSRPWRARATAHPASPPSCAGEDDALRSRAPASGRGHGAQLGLGERRDGRRPRRPGRAARSSAARSASLRSPRSTTASCTSTPANVTRYREPVAKPRTPKGRARLTIERLAELLPGHGDRAVRARPRGPVPAPGRHHPVGPVHRRAGQHGHAGALRALPGPGGAGRGEPRGRRGDHPLHRVLPVQDQEPDRHGRARWPSASAARCRPRSRTW